MVFGCWRSSLMSTKLHGLIGSDSSTGELHRKKRHLHMQDCTRHYTMYCPINYHSAESWPSPPPRQFRLTQVELWPPHLGCLGRPGQGDVKICSRSAITVENGLTRDVLNKLFSSSPDCGKREALLHKILKTHNKCGLSSIFSINTQEFCGISS